ncbi:MULTISPECIES: hypothetical protein [unclassified Clostridium]|uniref:hypothetical protein n=1 Tax=unclassified Clostridium TaxID=2614128 RepID=UPI00030D3047|nr:MULTISPECIES: hypothetical protein [unclassified Clostridium]
MELEQWLKDHDIKKMVMQNLEFYLSEYKKDDEEDFNELFKDMDFDKVKYEFHSVSYVINMWHIAENEERKYISAKVRLEYEESTFAEYEAIYDLDGEGEDDYLRSV